MSYKWVKLSDICERITDGSHFSPKTVDEGYPYITVRDIDKDSINFETCKLISKEDFNQLSKNGCSPKLNDLLFSKDGTVGKVALVDTDVDFVVLSSLAILPPKLNLINPSFLFYVLKSPDFVNTAIGKKTGVAIRRIILKNLKDIGVPLPSLATQQKIVERLDAIFAEIDKATAATEANVKNAKALFSSYLTEVFERGGNDWKEENLGDICTFDKVQGNHKNLPYVGMENIESKSSRYLGNLENLDVLSSTFKFDNRHVLYGRLRPYLNKVLLPNFEGHCSTEIFPILPCDNVDREFLKLWLLSDKVNYLINDTCTGSRMPRANMNQVLNFKFSFPKLIEQIKIVSSCNLLFENCKDLNKIYHNKIREYNKLKNSILQQVFNG